MKRTLSILGWIGTGLVFAAFAVRVVGLTGTLDLPLEVDRYAAYAAYAGLALVLLYTLGQWREIAEYFSRRQARYGAIATVGVVVALAVVIAINYVGARRTKRWDLTANKQNSLSEQSVKVVQSLPEPVKLLVFERRAQFDRFRARLNEYDYQSDKVSVEYIDPDSRPVEARKYEIQNYGTIVVEYKDKRQTITSDSEQDITNAIIKVTSDRELVVYFLQGHGEKDPTSSERGGYSAVADTLKRDNFRVERLPLAQQKDVPDDATVVVIAGPTSDLLPEEVEALKRYLSKGGKVMLLLDPPIGEARPVPSLVALAHDWGVDLGNNVVVDVSGATNDPSLAVAVNYPQHAITEQFETFTVFPLARSAQPVSGGVNGRTAQPIVETSRGSWAETNLAGLNNSEGVAMEADKGDQPGPVVVGAAVSAQVESAETGSDEAKSDDSPKAETRVVVMGDSDFASNAYAGVQGNQNFFANSVNWLAQQENLIAIRPKEAGDRRLTMTAGQQVIVFWSSLIGLPLVVLAIGVLTWRRRRQ